MTVACSILIVDSNANDLETLALLCSGSNYQVDRAGNSTEALEMFAAARHQIILMDYYTKPDCAITLIKQMRSIDPAVRAVIMTNRTDAALVNFLGEADSIALLLKPVRPSDLLDQIRVAAQKDRGASERLGETALSHRMDQCLPLLGCSVEISKIRKKIAELAATSRPVLLEGPFGVGKPDVTKFIHHTGGYSQSEIVVCPCEKMDRQETEARLISRDGSWGSDVERAHQGTLVLQRIEALPIELQQVLAKHFDALAEHCRIISWANLMMDDLLEAGQIDTELYFKLTLHTIHLPALAERPVDIEEITRFVAASPDAYGLARRMQGVELDLLVAVLRRSELPGNLRELIQRVRAAADAEPFVG